MGMSETGAIRYDPKHSGTAIKRNQASHSGAIRCNQVPSGGTHPHDLIRRHQASLSVIRRHQVPSGGTHPHDLKQPHEAPVGVFLDSIHHIRSGCRLLYMHLGEHELSPIRQSMLEAHCTHEDEGRDGGTRLVVHLRGHQRSAEAYSGALSCTHVAIRRNRAQSGAIGRNQVQSGFAHLVILLQ